MTAVPDREDVDVVAVEPAVTENPARVEETSAEAGPVGDFPEHGSAAAPQVPEVVLPSVRLARLAESVFGPSG